MRKSALLALAVLSFCSVAQPVRAQNFHIGVKFGPNSSWHAATLGGHSSFDPRVGFAGGLTGTVALTSALSFQPELLYAAKGISLGAEHMRLGYVEAPLLLRIAPRLSAPVSPLVLAGAAPSIRAHCSNSKTYPSGVGIPATDLYDPARSPVDCSKWRTSAFDLGLVGALGAEFRLSDLTSTVEVRYTGGLANITGADGRHVRNQSIAVLVEVRLRK